MKKTLLVMVLSFLCMTAMAQCPEKPNAGPDLITCKKDSVVLGSYNSSYYWKTWGWGQLIQNHQNSVVFIPWITDIEGGSVRFILHAEQPNGCPPQSDTLLIFFKDSVVSVNAGEDQLLCRSSEFVQLKGSVTNADKFFWRKTVQGYQGYNYPPLNPDSNTLTPKHFFIDRDKQTGAYHDMPFLPGDVQFILTGINTKTGCSDIDYSYVTFSNGPTVSIDPVSPSCNRIIPIKGHSNGRFFQWTTKGNGTFEYTTDSLTVNYIASVEDSIAGSTKIFLQASDICGLKKSDSLIIEFKNTAVTGKVFAGTDALDNYKITSFDLTNTEAVTSSTLAVADVQYDFELKARSRSFVMASLPKNSGNWNNYLPTYYDGYQNWEKATMIQMKGACIDRPVEANIQLVKAPASTNTTWNTGKDQLIVKVSIKDPTVPTNDQLRSLSSAIVLLYDEKGNFLTYDIGNLYGECYFPNLQPGTYKYVTEYPGTKSTTNFVTIEENILPTTWEFVTLSKVDLVTATNEWHLSDNSALLLFPQPAQDELNVRINGMDYNSGQVSIFNAVGQLEKEINLKEFNELVKINISDLEDGYYTIKITTGKDILQKGFIKVK